MRLKQLAVDSAAIENGSWRDAIGLPAGIRFKLRGADNYDWRRLQAKLVGDLPREKRPNGVVDIVDSDTITTELLLEASLQDWSGLEGEDGAALPFSTEAARAALADPDMRRFRLSVLATAQALSAETAADREDAAKN